MEASKMKLSSHFDLHVFFLPFVVPGHMIPMVDMARMVAGRGVKVTIVTSTANASLIQPTIDRFCPSIQILTLNELSSVQNPIVPATAPFTPEFIEALDSLQDPFQELLNEHRPDFIISDVFFTWTVDLGIPRLFFNGSSVFFTVVQGIVRRLKIHESLVDDTEPFVVPGMPHRIELTKSEIMGGVFVPDELWIRQRESLGRSYGILSNTFYELEPEYVSMIHSSMSKSWNVGPVSLCNQEADDKAMRGGGVSGERAEYCLNWLDNKKLRSVLYVCFGTIAQFTPAQLRKIAVGLAAADCLFIWAVRNCADKAEWMPEGFEERVVEQGKCLIVTGWAPQILILNHQGIGGFMTHCGWNSSLEGVSAGVPMITWPQFIDQFYNEKLLVDVLRIGVSVRAKVRSSCAEERTLVKSEEVKKAVNELMGSGDDAEGRRKRVKEAAEKAKKAVEEGGSSYSDMSKMIEEMISVKSNSQV